MKKISILCLALLSALTMLVGCKADPEAIDNTPEVFADEASELLRTSAVLTGRIMAPAKASIKEYGFLVSSSSDFSSSDTQTIKCDENLKEFSAQITDLEIGGTYFYAAYATNGLDRMTSTVRAFTTPTRSGVLLSDLRMVDEKTATFSARVADTGGGEINAVGLCWATDNTPTTYDETVITTLNSDNTFTASLTGLEAGKTYYVRAFADSDILGDGTTQTISYSRDVVEIRLEEPIKEEPSISVEALSSTTTTITYRATTKGVDQVRQMVIYEEALEVYGEITPELVFQGEYEIEPNTTVELTVSNLVPTTTYYVFVAAKAGEEYLIGEPAVIATQPEEVDPELTKIYYTTTDEQIIPHFSNPSGLNLVSNSYENGRGVITFDGAVSQIPNSFMYGEMTLKSIVLPAAVTQIGSGAFESCSALERVTLPEGLTEIGQTAFAYTALRELILPESVTEIDNDAFLNCSSLESVTLSGSPAVRSDAFSGCSSISSVHITSLEAWCKCDFGGWGYLMYSASNPCSYGATLYLNGAPVTEVTIPQGVTSLSDGAFAGCGSLLKVTIPDHVTEIGSRCFNACENLETVYCLSTTPATPKPEVFPGTYGDQYDWHPFPLILETFKIYVPNASVESYQTAWLWKQYADYIYPMDPVEDETPETWKIYYTSFDGSVIEPSPNSSDPFNANIISNTYEGGKGVIIFDGELTAIGDSAFEGQGLTSITIPESVVEIGAGAFTGCGSLTAIYSQFSSSDNRCLILNGELNAFAPAGLTEYTIPDQVTKIGNYALSGCSELTAITIPESVVEIGNYALEQCFGLISITIPDSVTKIGFFAFCRCENLKEITLSKNLASINQHAFYMCTSLESITFHDGISEIWNNAFYFCSSLKTVYCNSQTPPVARFYADSWASWAAFDSCSDELKIYVPNASVTAYKTAEGWSDYADRIYPMDGEEVVPETWKIYYTSTDGKVVTPTGTFGEPDESLWISTQIVSNTYSNGQGVIICDGEVTEIGERSFAGCSNLASIILPESTTLIEDMAFYDCSSLTSIVIPDQVTSIGMSAFYDCTGLMSVTIGNGVTTIRASAFSCTSLTSVTIPDNVISIGDYGEGYSSSAFAGCSGLSAFYGKFASSDNRCLIKEDGTLISFAPAGLTSYTIPNGVTSIGQSAFGLCSHLTSVTIPDSVTLIGENAFEWCRGLTSVAIGNGVTSIGDNAFSDCDSLTSIKIPDGVTSIGLSAFSGCRALHEVYCHAGTPPATIFDDLWGAFDYNASDRKIYVPNASVEAYKTASGWRVYADYIYPMEDNSIWGLCGTFNGWGSDSDIPMVEDIESNMHVAYNVSLAAGDQFKIRKNNAWDLTYGLVTSGYALVNDCTQLTQNGNENIIAPGGTYDIYFDQINSSLWLMQVGLKPTTR